MTRQDNPIQLIEQQRAQYALAQVKAALERFQTKEKKSFRSYARQFPPMIQMNGLGQAAAFYFSRGEKDPHKKLYEIVSHWLCKDSQVYAGHKDLLDGITEKDMHHYRRAQAEAQALLIWVKKFAEALCPKEEKPEANQSAEPGEGHS